MSTSRSGDAAAQAAALLSRWSQENFFKYMREHFGLDALARYGTEEIPDTVTVLNPAWRELHAAVRRQQAELKRERELLGSVTLDEPLSSDTVRHYEGQRQKLQGRDRLCPPFAESPVALAFSSPDISPGGEARCRRGPLVRGARRSARGGVLEQYGEHGEQAQRSNSGPIVCLGRQLVKYPG